MRRRVGIGAAGIAVSLTLGLAGNFLPWKSPVPSRTPQGPAGASPSRNENLLVKPLPSPEPPVCTAYNDPDSNTQDENWGEAAKIIKSFVTRPVQEVNKARLRYVIALVPDPRHTRLSMLFDRSIDAIGDAAQDDGFTYDSSWLPWRVEAHTYGSRDDEIAGRRSLEAREGCPGIMLFRKSVRPDPASGDPYQNGLAVFIIGEQPTGGLNSEQWNFAIGLLRKYAPEDRVLRVLGPTFSGTLPSLLGKLGKVSSPRPPSDLHAETYVFSGTIGSCQSVEWFKDQLNASPDSYGKNVFFKVFQENDDLHLYRFLAYLKNRGEELRDVAILSEDETAYGGSLEYPREKNNECDWLSLPGDGKPRLFDKAERPVALFYPRDISALRAAYQAQSIFSPGQSSADKQASRTVLSDDLQSEDNERGDTPPSYSTHQTALTEEAELYGLVSFLRSHHTRYVALRGSNPLDFLFLTRFLHHAFPEGRVVTVGSEMLFTRELNTTEFRGSMALTTFPLLPRLQHWSELFQGDSVPMHGHRLFPSSYTEGIYIASRFLMKPDSRLTRAVPPSLDVRIPDFADPYWLHDENQLSTVNVNSNTWLAVLGRDGYWPVAMLNEGVPESAGKAAAKRAASPPSTETTMSPAGGRYDRTLPMGMNPPMPWFFAIVLSLALAGAHIVGCCYFSEKFSRQVSNAFRPRNDNGFRVLVTVATAFACTAYGLLIAPFYPLWSAPVWTDKPISFIIFVPLLLFFAAALIVRDGVRIPFLTGVFCAVAMVFALIDLNNSNKVSYYYRAIHLSDGVSPLTPLLFLVAGIYVWTWQSLAGNGLLDEGRPQLPEKTLLNWRYARASADMATRIDFMARSFTWSWTVMAPPMLVALIILLCFGRNLPVLAFEGSSYSLIVNLSLLAVLLLIAGGSARLFWTWRELKRLLLQLGRMPLRRTFYALKSISIRSLWAMTGHVPRTQFNFFTQQMDAAKRLLHELHGEYDTPLLRATLDQAIAIGETFSKDYLEDLDSTTQWHKQISTGSGPPVLIRPLIGKCAGVVIEGILQKAWEDEVRTLDALIDEEAVSKTGSDADSEKTNFATPLSADKAVRAGEEFVCLLYISYVQNILARMRTIVFSMSALYISAMLALAFYPFAPRPSIAIWMLLALIVLGAVVAIVYSGLERDQILSYITNTSTKLGWEFWAKYATFLLPPLLALLTAQFPEIADSLLQWVQPGLDAAK